MADMKRHIGKISNTDRRCVVVYMQIPGREDHALVIDTDALHPRHHDELFELVDGDAQREPDLANIMGRRIMASSGSTMLATFHQLGLLQPVVASNVVMLPRPNAPVPLTKVIELTKGTPAASTAPAPTAPAAPAVDDGSRYSRVQENQSIDAREKLYGVAQGLIVEANMLMAEAARKVEQAYSMAPSLRPAVAPTAADLPLASPAVAEGALAAGLPADEFAEAFHAVHGTVDPSLDLGFGDNADDLAAPSDAINDAPTKRGPGRPRKVA